MTEPVEPKRELNEYRDAIDQAHRVFRSWAARAPHVLKDDDDGKYQRTADKLLELLWLIDHGEVPGGIAEDDPCDTVGPGPIVIKQQPELRHVLSHLHNAIEHLAEGAPESALHELESVAGLVFWETTDEMRGYLDGKSSETTRTEEVHVHGEEEAPAKGRRP